MNRWLKVCSVLSTIMATIAALDVLMVMVCMQVPILREATMNFLVGGIGCAVSAIAFDALSAPPEDDHGR